MSQHIHSFWLKDTNLFKSVRFEIPKGLTTIYGLNRVNGRKSKQANGAGKSSAFSSIGETLYEEPIVGLREDALKTGVRGVRLALGKKQVDVVRNGSKLEIKVDGKTKKFRTKALGREWLRKHLPLTQAEFNTYAFLDARVPHPLVMGSSTDRKRFFNQAFGLNKIDVERKIFEAELSKLKRVRAAYKELYAVFDAEREKALPKEKREALQAKLKAYEAELEDLNRKNLKIQTISQLLVFEASAAKQLQAFNKMCPVLEEFSSIYGEVKDNLKDNKAKLADAEAWREYQRDSRKYTKAYEALSDGAKALIDKLGLEKATRKCKDAANSLQYAEKALEQAEATVSQKPKPPVEIDKPEGNRKELLVHKEALEHQYEHARKFKKGKCGTCGQDVEIRNPEKLRKKVEAIELNLEQLAEYADYEEALAKYKADRKEYKAAVAELPDLKDNARQLKKRAKIGRELRDLPSEPEKFKGRKLETEVCQRMVDEDREQLALLDFIQPNLDSVKELRALTEKQRNAAQLAPKLRERVNEIHEKVSKLKARLEVNAMVNKSLKRHKARLLEMKEELKNEEPLRLLVEAYADKSIKKMAIQAISTRLMAEVNKYARLIFPEDFEFELRWDSSKLKLLVHRKVIIPGKKRPKVGTSDVRKLSGAESKLFTFILVLALLTFVPQRKRSNVLVLDEPSANFSAETTEAFKKLLPILNQVIPSIIVITPKTDERYEGAQEFTVLKDKGVATIVKGHPTTIK